MEITSRKCVVVQSVDGYLVQCGGHIVDIRGGQYGKEVIDEACTKCGQSYSLAGLEFSGVMYDSLSECQHCSRLFK